MKLQRALQTGSLAIITAAFFGLPGAVGAGEVYAGCDAGGPHSLGCSTTQNGKTCTQGECEEGYYPCCTFTATNPHCECVKATTEE